MMTSPTMAMVRACGSGVSRPFVFVAAAWRAATWKHFLFTSLLGLAWSAVMLASLYGYFSRPLRPGPATVNCWRVLPVSRACIAFT